MPSTPQSPSRQQEEVEVAYSDDNDSLSNRHSPALPLFDAESVLEIPKDVADGFLILLSGGQKSAKIIEQNKTNSSYESPSSGTPADLNFAFNALTDGNVIEATFGVESNGGLKRANTTSEIAFNAARTAKMAIMDASLAASSSTNSSSPPKVSVKDLSVQTYIRCFEIVIAYHLELESIGFITYCIKHHKVTEKAMRKLREAFESLNEAISNAELTS
jgi:hypothetical protein